MPVFILTKYKKDLQKKKNTSSLTLRSQKGRGETKFTRTGKKLSGVPRAVNSMAAEGQVLSMTGMCHTRAQCALSYSCSPSHLLMTGGGAPEARGSVMLTSLSSISRFSRLYSMLTSQLPEPFSCGQQLTKERDKKCSSALTYYQFTPFAHTHEGQPFLPNGSSPNHVIFCMISTQPLEPEILPENLSPCHPWPAPTPTLQHAC